MKTLGLSCIVAFSVVACGGKPATNSAADANCPPGQTFDGTYCQVDQHAPTQEVEVPVEPAKPEEQQTEAEPEKPADPQAEEPKPGEETVPAAGEVVAGEQESLAPEKSTAAPVDYAMAAQAGPVMQYFASSHLPSGARPLGAPFAGQFAEGQLLVKKVQLTANTCYTVVGMGLPPVTEVDLQLFDNVTKKEIIKDQTTGPQAVIGSRDTCYRPTVSGPVQLVVTVKAGQGIAAAQVFQK